MYFLNVPRKNIPGHNILENEIFGNATLGWTSFSI